MRIVVVGATGATGGEVVRCALAKAHEVVAVSRRIPDDASASGPLSFHTADVRDAASLASAFAGAAAVISTIGPDRNLSPGDLMSVGTANLLAACREAQVPRFVMQSGITLTDGSDLSAGIDARCAPYVHLSQSDRRQAHRRSRHAIQRAGLGDRAARGPERAPLDR
jgi:nucleoside-diphosphate-sugar epimerase